MNLKPVSVRILMLVFFLNCSALVLGQTRQVIVDADTGNEVDDFYALVRILADSSVEMTALNAAHWQTSHWAVDRTMENSHRLNQQLLGEMDLQIRTLRGAPARMYDWGDRAQHSAAAYEIIAQAEEKDRVTILVLGALTNVASAVFIQPEIAAKLEVYWLGTTMDFDTGVLKRNDFNPLMDPFALDYLLDSKVTMNIMPINVAVDMEIDYDELSSKIGNNALGRFLIKRWDDHLDGSRQSRVLWDLALTAAYLRPELAKTILVRTSRDSGNRDINFYSSIDAKAIYKDFYDVLTAFVKRK
ncbi:MAG: nucleoside hydrolase [Muricauda sp.]|nr:nucleoside hydrolase [Allomuricauda sp.]MBO6533530.1 nucleoside hydrolase [Allomuricauda sp.]MBO6589234.1 nucleoside hydrolase [Allomuricauda sp.]MBO6618859.1 nucleoside hydrolase [Allomuricauda sp.]MBO6644772.1 nucleoside hydrolase [Allomuricauda sp.]MBO6746672.1 nucleoside hydrolase [Allomuricauda sp.]